MTTARHLGTPRRATGPSALAAGAVVAFAVLVGLISPAPLAQAQATPCKVTEVTVVVAGQGTGCSPAGLTGVESLKRAGFSVTMVQTQPGFVCRLNGAPAGDPCVKTPPADAYWAYHHAPLGGQWTYSQLGAGARRAAAGTVEGWAFGNGAQPGAVPSAPVKATRTTTPRAPTSTRTQAPTSRVRDPRPVSPAPAPDGPGPVEEAAGGGAGADLPGPGTVPSDDQPGAPDPGADLRTENLHGGAPVAIAPELGNPVREPEVAPLDGPPVEDEVDEELEGGAPANGGVIEENVASPDSSDSEESDVLATHAEDDRTSPWPYVAAAGVLAALAAAGVVAARRFRR